MKRNFVRLAVLVTIVLLLGAGLTQAAPTEPATSAQSSSSAPTPTPSAPPAGGPSSSSTGQVSGSARPTIVESPPAAPATAAAAAAFTWNRSLRYAGSVFKPREDEPNFNGVNYSVNYRIANDGGCVHATSGNAQQTWNLPLTLPDGVQLQWLRMYYYDTDPTTAMNGWLTVYDAWGNIVQPEWRINSVDVSGGYNYSDVQITPPHTVDYSQYSYVLNWRPNGLYTGPNDPTDLQLCGFRLFYYQPAISYLPLVRR